ncbi:MAG TPA: FHA domain-containing protein [Candidatus Gemmiger avistercoris]|uniref:FHA domain-containing protein n=2 Tax=Eubacteriales TaxID=186802 RepID=A0A9D2FKR2_9FIRM|nr:FHA domain-containing protein [uncultured Subdoligranulum sp.]HIZ62909.1 FHA domain-containing protein [Candidatus Gemmiger avistercoris]
MKTLRYPLALFAALVLCLLTAPAPRADTTTMTGGAGAFRLEQAYVNVPDMNVFFYAQDAEGNAYTPTMVQAAGLELTLGDHTLDASSLGQASSPVCYLVVLDNSAEIEPADFRQMRGAVWQLIRHKEPNDQIALYTLAGGAACVQPATSDASSLYTALAGIEQAEGAPDAAGAPALLLGDIQRDYQALAPRKAVFLCTAAASLFRQPALLAGASGAGTLNAAFYTFVGGPSPQALEVLRALSNGQIIPCAMDEMGDGMLALQQQMASALELRTEVPENLAGERQEIVTLSIPSLGSAVQSSTTVYMGFRMTRPQVEKVEVLGRNTLRLTMNQAVNPNATRPQFYRVASNDIWNWHVPVREVEISEDGRIVLLTTDPLYKGNYNVALNKVSSRLSPANVSSLRDETDFTIAVWPRDRAFYLARFRAPLLLAAAVLAVLALQWRRLRRRDRAAEQTAEAEHLLAGTQGPAALPRRWVTLFWAQKGSIAESRWAGMVESSLILGSDAAQCDLCLPDAQVRAQHCVLCVRGESLLVQTLDPGAPVFVNGERIEGEHRLQNNDALRLGRTTVRLVL